MKNILFFLMLLLCSVSQIHAQQVQKIKFPGEGDKIPDYTFTDVLNYKKNSFSISEFRGQWLVLDWWAPGCLGCIASFPKMDSISKAFKAKVKIIMIGEHGKRPSIKDSKRFYLAQAKKKGLTMMAAFDSASFVQHGIWSTPYMLIINPEGVIVAKMQHLDSLQLAGFISGNNVQYEPAYSQGEVLKNEYNMQLPLLSTGLQSNGGIDTNVLARSILAPWNSSVPSSYFNFDIYTEKFREHAGIFGMDVRGLILTAIIGQPTMTQLSEYYGKLNPMPIVETKDTKLLKAGNSATGENMYSYSYKSIGLTPQKARQQLLFDIEQVFKIKVSIEKRIVSVWQFVVIDKEKAARLSTKGGERILEGKGVYAGVMAQNVPIDFFMSFFITPVSYDDGEFRDWPLILNESGLTGNIDISFTANMTDIQEVKQALHVFGLDLIKAPKEMDCIVIRDQFDK